VKRVLVISPHPDDEAIGPGGTIARHVADGQQVHVVFLTSGEKGGHGRGEQETVALREQEARRAAELLGISTCEFWRGPDGSLRAAADVVRRLHALLLELQPARVYVTHDAELHPDHRAAAEIVRCAVTGASAQLVVLMYEVWTPLQRFDEIVDITAFTRVKRAAIEAHQSQCDVVDFAAAALGLNRYRGELHSWPDGEYAEVFQRMHP
jgi:N-acetylglucosamine malate deacetylase 1